MTPSRLIVGLILTIGGAALIIASLITSLVLAIYGLIALILGIVILFNSGEDKIEEVKSIKGRYQHERKISSNHHR